MKKAMGQNSLDFTFPGRIFLFFSVKHWTSTFLYTQNIIIISILFCRFARFISLYYILLKSVSFSPVCLLKYILLQPHPQKALRFLSAFHPMSGDTSLWIVSKTVDKVTGLYIFRNPQCILTLASLETSWPQYIFKPREY